MNSYRMIVRTFILERFMPDQDPSALGDNTSLGRQRIMDSNGAFELIMHLEETFGIEIDNEAVTPENFDSVNNIVAFLDRQLGPRQ